MYISGVAVDHLPENRFVAELFDICNGFIILDIEATHKDCTNNSGCCVDTGSGKDGKNINMQLTGIGVIALKSG